MKQNLILILLSLLFSIGIYAQSKSSSAPKSFKIDPNAVVEEETAPIIKYKSDVDFNVPVSSKTKTDTWVLIIANETYLDEKMANVPYALNDGSMFKEYCQKTLGIPETMIRYCPNATGGVFAGAVDWLEYALNNFPNTSAIVYYCGHGVPAEKTFETYLIPSDGIGSNIKTCYSLKNLYKTLAETQAQSVTYFIDACFTGATRTGDMMARHRGVAVTPVKEELSGKTIVFSASSGDETAMALDAQGHGLFTYYLLKKIQDTNGNVSYGELADYIKQNVKRDAFLINEKPQTPVVATSPAVVNTWKSIKLK